MSKHLRKASLFAAVFLALCPASVWADSIIYDNGVPDFGNAYLSDPDSDNVFSMNIQQAQDFVLAADSTITDAHWWGVYFPSEELPTDDFTISFFAAGTDGPGTLLEEIQAIGVSRTDTGSTVQDLPLYFYSFQWMSSYVYSANETYYVSISNDTAGSYEGWFWATSAQDVGDSWGRYWNRDPWYVEGFELAFYLTDNGGVVPEPATIALLGIGLISLVSAQARRKSN